MFCIISKAIAPAFCVSIALSPLCFFYSRYLALSCRTRLNHLRYTLPFAFFYPCFITFPHTVLLVSITSKDARYPLVPSRLVFPRFCSICLLLWFYTQNCISKGSPGTVIPFHITLTTLSIICFMIAGFLPQLVAMYFATLAQMSISDP